MMEDNVDIGDMDRNLRRLRHELDSLWQSDEGLHAQMNSVIGALQELKLLQVQTALEELEDFSNQNNQTKPNTSSMLDQRKHSSRNIQVNPTDNPEESLSQECFKTHLSMEPSLFLTSSPAEIRHIPRTHGHRRIHRGSLSTSSSFSSQEDSTDSNFSSYDIDDSSDWTASLMNHSRNRQPLVLGDNVFADLVGNWLDLPEVGGQTSSEEQNDSNFQNTNSESSSSSHSNHLSKKLSLTASIFKRVLRRVRPRQYQESEAVDVCKQPKITCRKPKSDVSKPFWGRTRMKKKTTPTEQEGVVYQGSEGLMDRWAEIVEKHPPVFDYNSAVWV